ncbi:hypothetical protein NQ318_009526 [Aromia moschata]|uniref:Uncharacterized protein n=1 Tax=Aromia moschata TaxID=1265417 RepID=A0AAV8XE97_9CUCU|nr:hypothetical protein NQ318_009526 [Aromia moschata]
MSFTRMSSTLPKFECIEIMDNYNNFKIYPKQCIKYLGLIIDCHLKWDQHINYITEKIRVHIHIFKEFTYSSDLLYKESSLLDPRQLYFVSLSLLQHNQTKVTLDHQYDTRYKNNTRASKYMHKKIVLVREKSMEKVWKYFLVVYKNDLGAKGKEEGENWHIGGMDLTMAVQGGGGGV